MDTIRSFGLDAEKKTIIISVFSIAFSIAYIIDYYEKIVDQYERLHHNRPLLVFGYTIKIITILFTFFIVSCFLIRGVIKEKPFYMFPWLCTIFVYLIEKISTVIFYMDVFGDGEWGTANAICEPIFFGIEIYAYLEVYNYFKELLRKEYTVMNDFTYNFVERIPNKTMLV